MCFLSRTSICTHLAISTIALSYCIAQGASPADRQPSLQEILEMTEQDMEAFSATSVANTCTEFLKKSPTPAEKMRLSVLSKRATAYLLLGQYDDSLADYETVLRVDQTNLDARWGKTRALYALNTLDAALAEGQRLIDEHPNDASYLSTVAKIHGEKKNYKKCLELADKAIAADPHFPGGYYARFIANYGLKQNELALKDLNQFLERKPFVPGNADSTNPYVIRGMLLSDMGAKYHPEAVSSFLTAKKLEPASYEASMGLSTIYHLTGRHHLGNQWAQDATRVAPKRPGAWVFLGNSFIFVGEYEKAVQAGDKALAIEPARHQAHALVSKAYFLLRKYEKSYESGKKCLELDESDWEVHYRQAFILASAPNAKLRDGKMALQLAHKSCRLAGKTEKRCWFALSAAHAECGEFDKALAAIEKARKIICADQAQAKAYDRMAELLLDFFRLDRPFRFPASGIKDIP